MIQLSQGGAFVLQGRLITENADRLSLREINSRLDGADLPPVPDEPITRERARQGTLAYRILSSHNTSGDPGSLKLRVDSLASHDITYVGIIQTARAGGLQEFPVPYALTN